MRKTFIYMSISTKILLVPRECEWLKSQPIKSQFRPLVFHVDWARPTYYTISLTVKDTVLQIHGSHIAKLKFSGLFCTCLWCWTKMPTTNKWSSVEEKDEFFRESWWLRSIQWRPSLMIAAHLVTTFSSFYWNQVSHDVIGHHKPGSVWDFQPLCLTSANSDHTSIHVPFCLHPDAASSMSNQTLKIWTNIGSRIEMTVINIAYKRLIPLNSARRQNIHNMSPNETKLIT